MKDQICVKQQRWNGTQLNLTPVLESQNRVRVGRHPQTPHFNTVNAVPASIYKREYHNRQI